ncbi:gluconokinase [Longimicrobium sp.]|uniref:gluconokinase n=1 Tax=Longimicrobium sp. TaxID=2029185 RepID=UPI002E33F2DA|nr:FGGY family carbohydrate kinase [Longimicrobium sp.]HEX6037138.1 FGGY family carbohydrate kinase [Longimicrobium sp.]
MTDRPTTARRGPWILAVDIGTSSVRAGWMDAAGAPLSLESIARAEYAWRVTPDGGMETDAEALAGLCIQVIDAAVRTGRTWQIEPAAVSIAAFWHGLVGLGADGRAVTPMYGWGDRRARAAADALRARVDEDAAHGRTGCFLHEVYPSARLVWLRGAAGDSLPPATTWAGIGELLALRLFDQARASASMASGTGLMDLRRRAWDGEMLDAVGLRADALPPIGDAPFRGLIGEHARRWPELATVPWLPALGDGACASLGMGAIGRRVGLTIGTSAALRVLRADAEPIVPAGLWCYRLDERRTVAGRAMSNGGSVFAWLERTLRLPPADEMERLLAALPPAAHGLTVVPRLLPERPPRPLGPETGLLSGLTQATGPVEIARAWLEAAAFAMADGLDAVEAAFGPADEVVAGGGALHASPAWARIVADALGRPLRLAPHYESTMRGAALLALERVGAIDDAVAFAARAAEAEARGGDGGARLEPDGAAHAVYRAARTAVGPHPLA